MKRLLIQFCLSFIFTTAPLFTLAQGIKPKILNIAFVYTGSAQSPGWTAQHDKGRKAVETFFGSQIHVKTIENLKPGADAERILISLAREGQNLIFVTDPDLLSSTTEAAKRFPETFFEVALSQSDVENISSYDSRFYQAFYIFGQISAMATETGKIGFVANQQDSRALRCANAYILGAQSVDKKTQILISYAGDKQPANEAAAARRVIEAGVDFLSYQTDTPAPAQVAEQNGIWVFGNGFDMSEFAPQRQVSYVSYEWGGYYIKRVQAALQGSWKKSDVWAGFDEGVVNLGEIIHVDAAIRDKAIETRQKLIDNMLNIFTGPIKDQANSERTKKDTAMSDTELKNMDWYVSGNIKILSDQTDTPQ